MLKNPELVPDYILELVRQSIEMVGGEIYPKDMIQMVPNMLRKVLTALETRNKEMSEKFHTISLGHIHHI